MTSLRSHQACGIHYMDGPDAGPTLLLLHGVTRCWTDWEPLLAELTAQWRVIAIDHAGHGRSQWTPGAYRVADYSHRVAAFVRNVIPGKFVVLGHSLGAMVALNVAAEFPEQVTGAALEDPPFHTMGRDIDATPYRAQFAGMQQIALAAGDIELITNGLAEIRLPSPTGEVRLGDIRDRAALRYNAECLSMADPGIFDPLVAGTWLDGFDHRALWTILQCPVLLMQGDPRSGGTLNDTDALFAEQHAAHCRRVRFDGVGHQIHRSNPAHFGAVFRQWAADFSLR